MKPFSLLFLIYFLALPSCQRESAALGDACKQHSDCASETCLAAQQHHHNTGWIGGACVEECGASCKGRCLEVEGAQLCIKGCEEDSECREGYLCEEAACLPNCLGGRLCTEGLSCQSSGRCEAPAEEAAVGASCTEASGCMGDWCLEWDGGYCSGACSADEECGEEGRCRVLGDEPLCLSTCEESCREGYLCEPAWQVCLPDCRLGWDCGEEAECSTEGFCLLQGDALHGAPCQSPGECLGGLCLSEQEAWPEGSCSGGCLQNADCGEGASCRMLGDDPLCFPNCSEAEGCREGYICDIDWNVCLPDCRLGWNCADLVCAEEDGRCVPAPGTREVGELCTDFGECAEGLCLSEWGEGYCSGHCISDEECGAKGVCRILEGVGLCLRECAEGCREGYLCEPIWGVCLPDCRLGWDCGEGAECGPDGLCTLTPPNLPVGIPCQTPIDCGGGRCIPEQTPQGSQTGWSGGYCTLFCDPINGCPNGESCILSMEGPLCLALCEGGCREGYICDSTQGGCFPDCRQGYRCRQRRSCQEDGRCI